MEKPTTLPPQGKKLLEQVSDAIRIKHYSLRTEKTYVEWIKRFILFHNPGLSRGEVKRHPKDMGTEEIQAFIAYLATERTVSASTQNQALSAVSTISPFLLQRPLHQFQPLVLSRSSSAGQPTIRNSYRFPRFFSNDLFTSFNRK